MSRLIRLVSVCVLLTLVTLGCVAQNKPKVAVMNFDYGTVRTDVVSIFGGDQDVGKGISDLLVQKLLKDGKYRLIDRNALDKILAEQNFSNSDRADPNTAAKIGKVLGVQAIIIGSITQFGRDDKSKAFGGAGIGGGHFGIGGVKTNNSKAVVHISARIIDTSTAEILGAETGAGESSRKGLGLLGGGGGWGGAGVGGLDMSSHNFGATILGEAVNKAVDDLGGKLDSSAENFTAAKVSVSALVADVSGNTIILNVGKKSGVNVGDKFQIGHPGRTIKDPATGKVLKTITSNIGVATVTDVDDDTATANFNGSGTPQVKDVATSQ